jgi:hypothetical protein
MAYNYSQFVTSLANRMAISSTGAAFLIELPNIIDAAEQRCYREVDLQDARIVDASGSLTPASRTFNLPSTVGRFIVVEQVNVITPSGATVSNGTRNPLAPISRDGLDALWPAEANPSTPSVPSVFSMLGSQLVNTNPVAIRVGPAPDAAYAVEVQGTARPPPLSAGNTTTLLSQFLPDLFFAAAMVIAAGYQKNFGAQADDPKMAMSWETQYQIAKSSAVTEEFRRKLGGSAWSPMAVPPEAQPARA